MALLRRRRRHRPFPPLPMLAALFLLLSSSAISLPKPHFGDGKRMEFLVPGTEKLRQRAMRGLGSSPPTCRSKCGRCSPCWPVHVPIQPGISTPLEYYPEAWRCKCGNKLYMP